MRKSTSFFFTAAPSRMFTSVIWPSTRALTCTVENASTLPMALMRTGTVSCSTRATVTGKAAPPPLPFPPSLSLLAVLPFATTSQLPSPTAAATATTSATANTRRRLAAVMNRRLSCRNAVVGNQLVHRFAATHQMRAGAVDQHFGRPGARIVVRAHGHSIGAGGEDGEQVAFHGGEAAPLGEEIRTFAHGADNVVNSIAGRGFPHRLNVVPGVVERRADEVVHGRVDD